MTKILVIVLALAAACTLYIGCREESGSALPSRSGEHYEGSSIPVMEEEVVSIRFLSLRYEPAEQLIAHLSDSGVLRCSENGVVGGPPFTTRTLSGSEVAELLDRIDKLVPFGFEAANYSIPSGRAIEMRFDLPSGRYVVLRSAHPIYEQDPSLVFTANGVETLSSKRREEILQSQPKEYRDFRQVWHAIEVLLREYCEEREDG